MLYFCRQKLRAMKDHDLFKPIPQGSEEHKMRKIEESMLSPMSSEDFANYMRHDMELAASM